MGAAKDWMIRQWERGYTQAEGDICTECVSDPALADWVETNAESTQCTFCGRESDEAISAPFDEFVGVVLEGVAFDWNHPDSEGIAYESAEGGYQAELSDSYEVFEGYEISSREEVVDALIDSIDTKYWVQREFYRGDDSQRMEWGWDYFKYFTKHHTRYLFLSAPSDRDEEVPPSQMLAAISETINGGLRDYELIKTVGTDVDMLRVRVGSEAYGTAREVGTPPEQFANQPNRMSPAGIPMFYGAFDEATAIAETVDAGMSPELTMSVGTFRALRPLRVLDLADLPDVPSVFRPERHHLIHPLRFLHAFAQDIVQPIRRDGREHIEYVPTQIATEFFRRVFRDAEGNTIDGIVYSSSRHAGGRAFVLFCENEQCIDGEPGPAFLEPLMRLVGVAHRPCPEVQAPAPVVAKGLAAFMSAQAPVSPLDRGEAS